MVNMTHNSDNGGAKFWLGDSGHIDTRSRRTVKHVSIDFKKLLFWSLDFDFEVD